MTLPLHIRYKGLPPSEAVDAFVEEQFQHLHQTFQCQEISACHVTLELLNHRTGKAGCYRVNLELSVPGRRLVTGRETGSQHEHVDAYAALHAAFHAMTRRLTSHAERLHQDVKHHEPSATDGEVTRIFPGDGYGFLATADGREVYFNENAVLNAGWGHLAVGAQVRFCEEAGDKGPQASTVRVVHSQPKHHAMAH